MKADNETLRRSALILVATLLGATLLRLLGFWHDYPFSYFGDENHFVMRALSFGSFDLNPHWFHKPAFLMYLLFAEYGVFFLIGLVGGMWTSVDEFAVYFVQNPGPFYLIGRLTSMAFGIATIWLVYRFGNRYLGKRAGAFAAILLSLTYAHVVICQEVKADIPASFFVFLSLFFLFRHLERGGVKPLLLASAAAGMGAATKYYPMAMLAPIFVAIVWRGKDACTGAPAKIVGKLRWLGAAFLMFVGTYFVCAPYNFLDPLGRTATFYNVNHLIDKVAALFGPPPAAQPSDFISQPTDISGGFAEYAQELFATHGMGLPIAVISLVGLLVFLRRLDRTRLIFLVYPIVFVGLSVVSYPGYAEPRHQLPFYAFLALTGGHLLSLLWERSELSRRIVLVGLGLLLAWPTWAILDRGTFVSRTNTRQLAKVWIEANIPAGNRLLVSENGPRLNLSETAIHRVYPAATESTGSGQFTTHYQRYLDYQIEASKQGVTYDIVEIRFPWWRRVEEQSGVHELTTDYDQDMANPLKPVGVNSYESYVQQGFDYAIVHSYAYLSCMDRNTSTPERFPSFAAFYRDLFSYGRLVKTFTGKEGLHPGPEVRVYSLEEIP